MFDSVCIDLGKSDIHQCVASEALVSKLTGVFSDQLHPIIVGSFEGIQSRCIISLFAGQRSNRIERIGKLLEPLNAFWGLLEEPLLDRSCFIERLLRFVQLAGQLLNRSKTEVGFADLLEDLAVNVSRVLLAVGQEVLVMGESFFEKFRPQFLHPWFVEQFVLANPGEQIVDDLQGFIESRFRYGQCRGRLAITDDDRSDRAQGQQAHRSDHPRENGVATAPAPSPFGGADRPSHNRHSIEVPLQVVCQVMATGVPLGGLLLDRLHANGFQVPVDGWVAFSQPDYWLFEDLANCFLNARSCKRGVTGKQMIKRCAQ